MLRALLSNIKILAKKSKPKNISKEPYFDKKWGTNSAFQKTVDKASYAPADTADQAAQIRDQILVIFKTTKQADGGRSDFLNKITDDSIDFLRDQRTRMAKAQQEEQLCQNSMEVMTEHVFEVLKSYAYELNSALGYGPFHLAATNAQSVTEVLKFNGLRQPEETINYYRARLSTPSFSLVLRGDKRGIHFFIMPVARALGLSKQECQFLPILRLSNRLDDNGTVCWQTESGRALTPSMVEVICMNIFQRLIDETKLQVRKEEESKSSRGFDELFEDEQGRATAS